MKRLCVGVSIWLACAALPALAQSPGTGRPAAPPAAAAPGSVSPSTAAQTPEMWFYEQYMSQYQDPKLAVRRKAEFRAQQRENRLAAMRWFGLSNSRPRASSDPWNSDWSPGWASNNTWYPYRWTGIGRPWVYLQPNGTYAAY
jgi:hypothetical protein